MRFSIPYRWNDLEPRRTGVGTLLFLALAVHSTLDPRGAMAQVLSLEEAMQLAETGQPLLAAQRAGARAAEHSAIAAAQLPDPKLRLGLLNLPVDGAEAFTLGKDFMTMRMIGLMQEFPRAEKRRLRGELARLEGEKDALEYEFVRRTSRRDAGMAWVDVWAAQRAREQILGQRAEAATRVEATEIGLRNGRASIADLAEARLEFELLGDREVEYVREEDMARADLGRWIGEDARRSLPVEAPALQPAPDSARLLDFLGRHPHLAASGARTRISETDARLAQQTSRPDWNLELSYAQRGPAYSNMVSVQLGIDLPLFTAKRQDRQARAKILEADRARELQEDNLRQMRADLMRATAEHDAALARARLFRDRVLPQAQARLEAESASYRAGKSSLNAVLEARRSLLDLKIETLRREADAARTGLQLAYFAAEEDRP